MYIEEDDGVCDITPHKSINEASFLIRVKDASKLDYKHVKGMFFKFIYFFLISMIR